MKGKNYGVSRATSKLTQLTFDAEAENQTQELSMAIILIHILLASTLGN